MNPRTANPKTIGTMVKATVIPKRFVILFTPKINNKNETIFTTELKLAK